jgi:hypothetical protein
MTAEEFATEATSVPFSKLADHTKAHKYFGKTIILTGEVRDVVAVGSGKEQWQVALTGIWKSSGSDKQHVTVQTWFKVGTPLFEKAKSLKEGTKVTIRGKFDCAFDWGARLVDCDQLDEK